MWNELLLYKKQFLALSCEIGINFWFLVQCLDFCILFICFPFKILLLKYILHYLDLIFILIEHL